MPGSRPQPRRGPEQLTERRMTAHADTNPSVQIRWHTVPFAHSDYFAIDVMKSILSDRTGRLYKSLVEAEQIATGDDLIGRDGRHEQHLDGVVIQPGTRQLEALFYGISQTIHM